jgi:membrane dipeptidase
MIDHAATLHADSIVIDAVCPLAKEPTYLDWYRKGGVTCLAPTMGGTAAARPTLDRLAAWHRVLRQRADLALVRTARDVEESKQTGRLGIYFHFQGSEPIEDNLDLVDLYRAMGVGMIQLAYNIRNRVGDGCEEEADAGLSHFGRRLVARLNEAKVIVDCSHTGSRTTHEAIERSSAPVVLSHSNSARVHKSDRNVANAVIRAIAQSGGVVGLAGFPTMVGPDLRPSLDQYVAHIDAIVELAGIDHVALGLDYYLLQAGVATTDEAMRGYRQAVDAGLWNKAYPPPPHYYPAGIETPVTLPELTRRLVERGYGDGDVRKILGQNWLRVMRAVWG